MSFTRITGTTSQETAKLNKEFIDSILDIYNLINPDDILRDVSKKRKVLAMGKDYIVTAKLSESGINWTHLCNYMSIDVYFEDMMNPSNNKLATLNIETDGGWDNNSWKKLKGIMDGDIQPDPTKHQGKLKLEKEPRLKEGILIRTKGTDFYYSKDEYDDYRLSTTNNNLQLMKNNKVVKYFNLDFVVTIDFEYNPEVNDYAELKDYIRSNNERGVEYDN